MIDILSGALGGGGCSRLGCTQMRGNSVYLQALDPAAFGAGESFPNETATLVDYVKSSATAPGFDRILVPGEVEHETRQARLRDGIPIEDETWQRLRAAADRLGLTP
jgi:hydroxycarboxylate dehydrogenase B